MVRQRYWNIWGQVLGTLALLTASPSAMAQTGPTTPNLFSEIGKSEAEIDSRINRMWSTYFEGDVETERLYFEAGADEGFVVDIHNADVRTEGQSYAMMIAVQMDRRDVFDRIWRFSYRRMLNKEGPLEGYFCWHYDPWKEECKSRGPAPDGEEYFAMALYFADARWGSVSGELDYKAHADEILREMLHQEEDNGGVVDRVTNMIDAETNMIVFVPSGANAEYSDPSYHLPAFYELFSRWALPEDRARWATIRDVSRDYLANIKTRNPDHCLMADYAGFDGEPVRAPFNPDSENFQVDAWRTIFNWSVDAAWWGVDERQAGLSECLLGFFADPERGGGISAPGYRSSFKMNGQPVAGSGYKASGLVAMNATGAMATDADWTRAFVEDFWSVEPPTGTYRYYNGMLYMLATLALSGDYTVYCPDDDCTGAK
ncbi:glycosyl hydrolase family 8 [Parvularcula sp. LCG005]|uniref:glycosyl hydrolase family 8 n=1 Tax=Parvularcula sp. LCG005 TaxID=3078805 RepID=UPI00294304F3|nr:glycosyl hydrolase family 8 [Parvularcula sp. LCG005]WOI53807.1 glycosyl hydrolase family 8 [Parvularcula sp. LCG005]